MANILKRNDSYRISVSNGRDIEGKQIIKYTTYKPTSTTPKAIDKEVKAFAKEFETKVREGRVLSGESMTFAEFTDQWFNDWAKDHLTTSQLEQYQDTLKRRVFSSIGNVKLSKITPLRVQDILKKEQAIHAPKTVRRTFTAMNSVFKFAYRMNVIQENPCSRCELPRLKADTDLHYFTLDQAQEFLHALDMTFTYTYTAHTKKHVKTGEKIPVKEYTQTHRIPFQFQPYYYLAVFGGFRRGEMTALTWEDIDFEEKTVSINKAIAKTKEGEVIKEPKTKAGIRTLIMPEVCFDILQQWKDQEIALCKSLGSSWKGYSLKEFDKNNIFIQNDGSRMVLETPYNEFKKIIELYNMKIEQENKEAKEKLGNDAPVKQKLPDIRLHDLRHTSATLLLSENVDIETVSHRMGHSKASVTLDVYGHALETKDKTASEALDKLFSQQKLYNICITNPENVIQNQKTSENGRGSNLA